MVIVGMNLTKIADLSVFHLVVGFRSMAYVRVLVLLRRCSSAVLADRPYGRQVTSSKGAVTSGTVVMWKSLPPSQR